MLSSAALTSREVQCARTLWIGLRSKRNGGTANDVRRDDSGGAGSLVSGTAPAVWQLGPSTHKRLVAGRQSPLQGDKRLSISTCVTSESPRADIAAPVPPSICRANRGQAEAHGRVACARTLRGADADAAPKTRSKPSTGSQIGKGCTLRQSKAVTPDIPM